MIDADPDPRGILEKTILKKQTPEILHFYGRIQNLGIGNIGSLMLLRLFLTVVFLVPNVEIFRDPGEEIQLVCFLCFFGIIPGSVS